MTSQITSGIVSVEDGKKPSEEYAPARKVRVELHFDVEEGGKAQPFLDMVANMASRKVAEMLGTTALTPAVTAATVTVQAPPATPDPAAPKRGPGRPPKAPPAPPADPSDEIPGLETALTPEPPAAEEQSLDDIMGLAPVEAPVISDADMNAAVQKKNATLQDPPLIRGLITKFQPEEGKPVLLANIPADKRGDFLAELEALTK